jgi:RNA polymerase sigma-70 factor, ECF subfamily
VEVVIARAREGDREALGLLWRTYQHLLLRYFRGKGMAEPEDLASTVWLEVANGLSRFAGGEPEFRRWLFTIAARRRIDDIRAVKRRANHTAQLEEWRAPVTALSAAEESERGQAIDRALALIRTLPPDQAEAVLLRVIADLSVAEVAAIMGRREGTVRVLVHRGLKRLAERSAVTEPPVRTMSAS